MTANHAGDVLLSLKSSVKAGTANAAVPGHATIAANTVRPDRIENFEVRIDLTSGSGLRQSGKLPEHHEMIYVLVPQGDHTTVRVKMSIRRSTEF